MQRIRWKLKPAPVYPSAGLHRYGLFMDHHWRSDSKWNSSSGEFVFLTSQVLAGPTRSNIAFSNESAGLFGEGQTLAAESAGYNERSTVKGAYEL